MLDLLASPVIYPEDFYRQYNEGKSIEDIAAQQYAMVSNSRDSGLGEFDPTKLTENDISENLFFQVLNKDMNEEIMKACPYKDIAEDLIAIPRYNIGTVDGATASFVFTYKNMEYMKLTKEEVFDICQRNIDKTEYTVRSMADTLADIFRNQGMPEESIDEMIASMQEDVMYVITDTNNFNGSAALLNDKVLQETFDKIGQNYLIIPSSRMELLAVPDTISAEDVLAMVIDVNRDVLSKADYLATNVYRYDGRYHELKACFDRYGKAIDYSRESTTHMSIDTQLRRKM